MWQVPPIEVPEKATDILICMLGCKLANESEEQDFDSFGCRTNIANKTICPIVRRGGLYVGDQMKARTLKNYYSPI